MSPELLLEAALVGAKEALKLGAVWAVFTALALSKGRKDLLKPFYLGVAVASGFVALSFFLSPDAGLRLLIAKSIGYVFFLFFLGSVLSLYHFGGPPVESPGRAVARAAMRPLCFALTVVYFLPDIMGSSMFIRELSVMRPGGLSPHLPAALGFALVLALLVLVLRPRRAAIARYFDLSQFLLFLAVLKLLAGGVKGFAEMSLVPSVQRGIMKFVHDAVHQTLIMLMVPDHPMLSTTTWNYIGFVFGPQLAIAAVLLVLLVPPLIFVHHSLAASRVRPSGDMPAAQRRLQMSASRADMRRKAVPVALFVAVILAFWFGGRGDGGPGLVNPEPRPVVPEGGVVILPIKTPSSDLRDGGLHKFSMHHDGHDIGILVIKKPNGKLAVTLDACEICPPEGYGLVGDNVVCIYCRTPIPISTLGSPGGCNPIPLKSRITDDEIIIMTGEILGMWDKVVTGEAKRGKVP